MINNDKLILDVILRVSQIKKKFNTNYLEKLLLKINKKQFADEIPYLNALLMDWVAYGYVSRENDYYTITEKGTTYALGFVGELINDEDALNKYKTFSKKLNKILK